MRHGGGPFAAAVASEPPLSRTERTVEPRSEREAIAEATRGMPPGTLTRVVAYAGAGKTATLRLVARRAGRGEGIYVAFNADTAEAAQGSFGRSVTTRTMHSVAWRALGLRGVSVRSDRP